jgi:hypothetical protein
MEFGDLLLVYSSTQTSKTYQRALEGGASLTKVEVNR